MNYLKIFEDGTSEAVDVKPSWGMYEKEHALDNREVYIDGNWYSTTGGELVTNGTFDTDISGWTAGTGAISWNSGKIRITNNTGATTAVSAVTYITTEIGSTYRVSSYGIIGTNVNNIDMIVGTDANLAKYYNAPDSDVDTSFECTFVAEDTIVKIQVRGLTIGNGTYSEFDNVTAFKAEPTIDTLQLPHTYLSNKGKLAGIEVVDGIPVDIHYDELAPTLVEDTIKVSNLVVTDGFDLGQSLVNVKSERASRVTYTNDTGKPIEVSCTLQLGVSTDVSFIDITKDGVTTRVNGSAVFAVNGYSSVYATVPVNATYTLSANATIVSLINFAELR